MFQKLCKAQRDWEELVDTELNQEWLSTLSDLRLAGRVSFKRCYAEGLGGNEVKSLQLHCFADASEIACSKSSDSGERCEVKRSAKK